MQKISLANRGRQSKYTSLDQVATRIQSIVRTRNAQRKAQLLQWARYNWAAAVIQRAYRAVCARRDMLFFRFRKIRDRCSIKINNNNNIKLKNGPNSVAHQLRQSFQRVINGKASYEDKMACWRLAVELRRGHNFQTTDTCIKAVLESQADIKQSQILLGIPEFSIRHFSELPKHTKKLFLFDNSSLLFGNTDIDSLNQLTLGTDPASVIRNSLEVHKSAGIETIRALKRLQKRQALIDTINYTVNKSFFSKFHVGSKYSQPPYPKFGN